MQNRYCYIDFEFNRTAEPTLNLVSCAYTLSEGEFRDVKYRYWLHNDEESQLRLKQDLADLHEEGYTFVAYAVTAEARSMLSLGLPVSEYRWIDLWIEHRCLTNHNWRKQYGRQLIKGKVKNTFPPKPKWERTEGDPTSAECEHNLAAACFKFLNKKIDTAHKNQMRDLIISNPSSFNAKDKEDILRYNVSDIDYLPKLMKAMAAEYKYLLPATELATLREEMLWRGQYAARTAMMEHAGYPIDVDATKSFAMSVPLILADLQRDINSQFDFKPFQWNRNEQKFKWRQKDTRSYLEEIYPEHMEGWMLTDNPNNPQLSLSLDAFSKYFSFNHDYPRGNFGAQIVRYLKTKQSLNGFLPSKNKTIWDSLGSDGRVRPYFNIYRAQSSRSQPTATNFIFLKAAWTRSLVAPKPGKAIAGIDWKSNEFLVGGLLSGDRNMQAAYASGDVYLWFGKAAGRIPSEGTKKTHGALRDRFKSTVLGIQYLMGYKALAAKITNDTGVFCSEEEAQELIELFVAKFSDYAEYREEIAERYQEQGYLKLSDGWYMWGDNENYRSVANCPVQGTGAVAMRRSVANAQDRGLNVIKTLHDALYIEFDSDDLGDVDTLSEAMDSGFRDSFDISLRERATCGLDANIWSPDYPQGTTEVTTPGGIICKRQDIYIDGRSINEYNRFKKYFDRTNAVDLL